MKYTAKQRNIDYATVFGTMEGKRVFDDILSQFSVLKTTHVIGDANHSSFLEGQRSVILYMLGCLSYKIKDVPELAERMVNYE